MNTRLKSLEAKLLFTWSIPHLDREGLMEADAATLKATVVPLIKEITEVNIDGLVLEIGKAGLWEIFDIDDTRYIRDPVFHERQNVHPHEAQSQIIKKIKGLKPISFTGNENVMTCNVNSRLKKERKKFKEFKRKNIYTLFFEEFWEKYPNHTSGKQAAFKSWEKVNPDAEMFKVIMDSIEQHQSMSREWREGFIPHATTWLNQGRWTAEFGREDNKDEKALRDFERFQEEAGTKKGTGKTRGSQRSRSNRA